MNETPSIVKSSSGERIIFILSLLTAAYWIIGNSINVYKYAVIGAVFELLWVFMLAALFVLPLISLIAWIRKRFSLRSLVFYALIISVVTLVLTVTRK